MFRVEGLGGFLGAAFVNRAPMEASSLSLS